MIHPDRLRNIPGAMETHIDPPTQPKPSQQPKPKPIVSSKPIQSSKPNPPTPQSDKPSKSHLVDRLKQCPFLIRSFVRYERHHHIDAFAPEKVPSQDEIPLYTWKDASLKEITQLLARTYPKAIDRNVSISFKAVFQDTVTGQFKFDELGTVSNHKHTGDETKTLQSEKFLIGDYLDIAILEESESRDETRQHGSMYSRLGSKRSYGFEDERDGKRGFGFDHEKKSYRDSNLSESWNGMRSDTINAKKL